ncbi:MAG: hypothetical protein KME32_25495 [Mojavia pulchra JT2-VF2]|uniref:Uncharacterized protein n=1 Tax=Mojavia pulchra JT2-VF2 TaxID=287848 RepID=A0A951Q299_9NOST|nr:hypothetical protein [Mojavia pulchra JT2-VF2]
MDKEELSEEQSSSGERLNYVYAYGTLRREQRRHSRLLVYLLVKAFNFVNKAVKAPAQWEQSAAFASVEHPFQNSLHIATVYLT